MALSIIGAGFGRTGTESLKKALEILGFGPCYHMYEVVPHAERVALWRAAAMGDLPDWNEVFSDYRATVDWPAAFFWRELSAHFPEAKIILSVRDADGWYRSMDNTILKALRTGGNPDTVGQRLVAQRVFKGRLDDRDHIIAAYKKNTSDVQAAFDPNRLLTYELGSGWKPLCDFLGCEIPDDPYPRSNNADDFHRKFETVSKR
ncbi:MAG: sulfotransferase family protein [Pseudomonadota bacterium]